jgi:hypothetical protein
MPAGAAGASNMRVERIDESVKVRADFQGGGITPLLFRRGSQDYRVSTVNAQWEDREGMQKLLYFSVTATTGDLFQLKFHAGDMLWTLETVTLDG